MNEVVIVLARPVDPRNIGAAFRAVANFGFAELRVVLGESIDRDAVTAFSSGAADVARLVTFESLAAATADCHQVVGTSVRQRDDLNPTILPSLGLAGAFRPGARVAIVFGTERTGLTREEIDRCDAVVMLPTAPGFPTMNLSHAVACVAYELRREEGIESQRKDAETPRDEASLIEPLRLRGLALNLRAESATEANAGLRPPTDVRARDAFYDHVRAVCGEIGFPPGRSPETVVRRLRKILGRADLSPGELSFIAGFFTEMRRLARLLFLARN
ncbi:MAG: RNA methyltransferase [Deltaproteobacteria bacterium]|nr:RNA methyltransferase [Deltaproteobacteria bacterium]